MELTCRCLHCEYRCMQHQITVVASTGSNVALLDLWRAYLPIHIHESLWAFQTVIFKERRYCLMCLGFVVLLIMKAIVKTVLALEELMM